jgi:NTP pyrophosphatase (non-canonical NTP hydrolase)
VTEQASIAEVLRTYAGAEAEDQKLCLGALGLTGEAGEVADIVKKHLFQGHALDRGKLRDELGDVLWYYTLICQTMGFGLDEVMTHNVEKLHQRYPNGFEAGRSIQRETSQ